MKTWKEGFFMFTQKTSGLEPEKRTSYSFFFKHFQWNILFFLLNVPSSLLWMNLWKETYTRKIQRTSIQYSTHLKNIKTNVLSPFNLLLQNPKVRKRVGWYSKIENGESIKRWVFSMDKLSLKFSLCLPSPKVNEIIFHHHYQGETSKLISCCNWSE